VSVCVCVCVCVCGSDAREGCEGGGFFCLSRLKQHPERRETRDERRVTTGQGGAQHRRQGPNNGLALIPPSAD
jgi:hypothetical protein